MSKVIKGLMAITTLAALQQEEQAAAAHALAIANRKAEILKKETDNVASVIDSFPAQLSKIMGRPVDMKEAISLASQRLRGTFGSLTSGAAGDRGKRLDDTTKAAIRAQLLAHCAALKAGTTPEPLSAIAVRHGIQTQTLDTYKPTAEQVAALPGANEVPASRMQAVAA